MKRSKALPSDIRALGRLGDAMSGPTGGRRRRRARMTVGRDRDAYVARRRGRVPRPVIWAFAIAALILLWVGFAASRQVDDVPVAMARAGELAPADVPDRPDGDRASRSHRDAQAPTFAAVAGLQLSLPHVDAVLVAFHEATRPEALPLDPVGRLVRNDNATKFAPGADGDGPDYAILSSRGRARPATSAADIALPVGSTVAAPVSGRVVEVREYALYGKIRDWRVVIEPTERPDLHVVLVHLERPVVEVGDEVEAGVTGLAQVRQLPFASHVDYITDEPHPHTHVEVKPASRPEPLDPNAPALPAEED